MTTVDDRPSTADRAVLRRRGSWRPALRVAMREPLRHKVRSALIAALIALPVLAMAFLSVIYSTQKLTPQVRAEHAMGQADGILSVAPVARVSPPDPSFTGQGVLDVALSYGGPAYGGPGDAKQRDPRTVDPASLLPRGAQLTRVAAADPVSVRAGNRRGDADVVSAPFVSATGPVPIARGAFHLDSGHWPAAADQVALSPATAKRFGLDRGSTLQLARGGVGARRSAIRVMVSGIVADASCLSCAHVFALPPTAHRVGVGGATGDMGMPAGPWLVRLPAGADPHALWTGLAASGVTFLPRDGVLHPSRYAASGATGSSYGAIVAGSMIIGFGLLEVVLLAGAAFAVGAKRQVRELGLVGASGGTPRDVRRIVLAQGLVLGMSGGLAGLAIGFAAALGGWSQWESLAGHLFGGLVVTGWQLAAIVGFGVLAGVLAALVPAVSASRMPVVAALSNRFVPRRKPMRRPLIGVGLIAVGTAVSFVAAIVAHGREQNQPTNPLTVAFIGTAVIGIGIVAVGIMLASPALVAGLGALAHRMPLIPRLAARDADRHRHRTAPAIAAISLAVAGTIAIGFVITGNQRDQARGYQPSLPIGSSELTLSGGVSPSPIALTSIAHELGGSRAVAIRQAYQGSASNQQYVGVLRSCASRPAGSHGAFCNTNAPVLVSPAHDVPVLTGHALTEAARSTLAGGGMLALAGGHGGSVVRRGRATLQVQPAQGSPRERSVRALGVDAPAFLTLGGAIVTPSGARALGLSYDPPSQYFVRSARAPSTAAEDRANALLGVDQGVYVERGFHSHTGLIAAVLGGASGLVTVAGVAIAVGLAAAEGRADLATLAAVGAAPRRRRRLAMAQAAVVGGIGVLVGVGFGILVSGVMIGGFHAVSWAVPWLLLGVVVVGVPVLAMLVAGLFTRSRLPMVRRIA